MIYRGATLEVAIRVGDRMVVVEVKVGGEKRRDLRDE